MKITKLFRSVCLPEPAPCCLIFTACVTRTCCGCCPVLLRLLSCQLWPSTQLLCVPCSMRKVWVLSIASPWLSRLHRYREKRKRRTFEKTIRYESRKAYAEVRPRIKVCGQRLVATVCVDSTPDQSCPDNGSVDGCRLDMSRAASKLALNITLTIRPRTSREADDGIC